MLAYMHIPFCDSKCHYCAFNSYTHLHAYKKEYMQALFTQLEQDLEYFDVTHGSIETLFIGGGTPSTVEPELYAPLFRLLAPYFAPDIEITAEANPNSATYTWLEGMHRLGVNRISFGVQTFNEKKLAFLNRAHTAKQAKQAILDAKNIGIANLSLDLIYGTAHDTKALLEEDLNEAFSLPINHLSAYSLTIEEHTPFEATPDVARERGSLTQYFLERIQKKGFPQYEISNFGTYQSRHNLGYWQYKEYLGLGAGAVGCVTRGRYYPHSNVQAYIHNPTYKTHEALSASEIKSEKLLLGLRSIVGCDLELFSTKEKEKISLLSQEGKLIQNNNRFFNPNYLLSDEIALFILD